ncbi:MAG: PAS domain S-box protein [Sneathiella sp.]
MNKNINLDSILQDALEKGSKAFVIYDKRGVLVSCNQKFRDLYGYTEAQASQGTHVTDLITIDTENANLIPGFDNGRADDFLNGRYEFQQDHKREFEFYLNDGRCIAINERSTAAGGSVCIQRDVSERQKLKTKLQQNEGLFRAAFDADSNICSLSVLKTGALIDVNAVWCETLGFTREEAIGKTAMELHIWKSQKYRDYLVEQIGKAPSTREFNAEILTRSGDVRTLSLNSEIINANGVECMYFSAKDITEELEVTKALEESERRLVDFTRASNDWYWETDEDHRFTFISPVVERSTGIPAEDYIGFLLEDITGSGSRNQKAFRFFSDMMAAHKSFRDLVLYRFRKDTGQKIWLRTSGLPSFADDGKFLGYRGSCTDITGQVVLEEKLLQSQKMEAVGQLTGGVAHDFNNLLAVIQGNAEMVKEAVETKLPELVHYLEAIMRASDRGAELTQSMLAFSRKQDLVPSIFRLDQHIEKMIKLVKRTIGDAITVNTEFDKDLWHCKADPAKLESALLNLCINARDAMSNKGILTIEIRNLEVDESYAAMERDVIPGLYVSLIVSDTGCGISSEKLPHIVEPFYTTKEVGKGTGLGLSMVYGFARQSNGHLSIYSEVDIGTTVRLLLPAANVDELSTISEKTDHKN